MPVLIPSFIYGRWPCGVLRALTYDLMRALDRDAEFLSDFFQRVAVHVAQDDLCVAFGFGYVLA